MSDLGKAIFGSHTSAGPEGPFFKGVWNGAETVDSNLSSVTLTGDTAASHFVPKLSNVGGLSAGDGVLLVKTSGKGLLILGKIVGDISKAG